MNNGKVKLGTLNVGLEIHHKVRLYCVSKGFKIREVVEAALEEYIKEKRTPGLDNSNRLQTTIKEVI